MMEGDEKLQWIERRVSTSLKPRAEELKILLSNEDSRDNLLTFCNKEEVRVLFVYLSEIPGKLLTAELSPPRNITNKILIFIKLPGVGKLTSDNILNDVTYIECGSHPMKHFERISRDVYLPLLSTDQSTGISSDKLLDIMHRLVSCLQLINGRIKGQVVLPMPSMEVLANAASDGHRRLSVIHVLETTLITWIKQIKHVLRLDIDIEITKMCGKYPFPRAEVDYWSDKLEVIESINDQLQSPVGSEILRTLEEAQSAYTVAFHNIMKEINIAAAETQEQLKYLNTVMPWFVMFENSKTPHDFVKTFKPMIRLIFLLWEHSGYYHQKDNFQRLLRMMTNGVVQKAREMVGSNVLDDLRSHGSLRQALHVCASYRGCYLDMKEKADKLNKEKLTELAALRTENVGIVWHSKVYKESRTPRGGDLFTPKKEVKGDGDSDLQWGDSQWPPRNHLVFYSLNSFMERCNDVLELVETTRHFNSLACTAALGGAGSSGLDAVVRDIHEKFVTAAQTFRTSVKDVLDVSREQNFERSFFVFRSVIRDLETRLGEVLHHSFQQCWDTTCRLRLLEVFEGTSSRKLVQEGIQDIVSRFVLELMDEVKTTMSMFKRGFQEAPKHCHLPPVVNELIWLTSLRTRLEEPFAKLRLVSPNSLKGDNGWKLRDLYSDLLHEIERNEQRVYRNWEKKIQPDLHLKLQQPLLVRTSGEDGAPLIKINFDPDLQQILKESHHLKRMYRQADWPEHLEKLLASAHPVTLELMAARLRIVTSHYNELAHIMTERERPLFQKKLLHIETLIEEGTLHRCWKDVDALDYVEQAVHSICNDVHKNLSIILENKRLICELVSDLGTKEIDELLIEKVNSCISPEELSDLKRKHREEVATKLHMYGIKIGDLISSSFVVANVGSASPAWLQYKEYLHHIVMEGLRESVISCLTLLLKRMVASATNDMSPLLTVRMELVGSTITFRPPLDTSISSLSLTESLEQWLVDIVRRSSSLPLESMNFSEEIETDPEVTSLIEQIRESNQKTIEKCEEYLSLFKKHGFIWMQDVKKTFSEFLKGNISSKPRDISRSEEVRSRASIVSTKSKREAHASSSRTSSLATAVTSGLLGLSEWSLLTDRRDVDGENLPTLDDFDSEMEVYQKASEEISSIEELVNVGWVCLNMQPIKKTLETYSRKWIFTYTKYMADQISATLKDFDEFLKRIEPGVEAITGHERDVMSFMKLMRIFNEVSAEQAELDAKFITIKRSIGILEKYKQQLPESTALFYKAAPSRWNNLKMKVSQAKQRLGPRIQSEAEEVTKTLQEFDDRCRALLADFNQSEALRRHCHAHIAMGIMETLQVKFNEIRKEAQFFKTIDECSARSDSMERASPQNHQESETTEWITSSSFSFVRDLIELQELLEKNIADFSMLQRFSDDLNCLHKSWDIVRSIREHHQDWKRHRWQKIRPRTLKRLLDSELEKINHLPSQAHSWDFVIGLQDAVHNMLACIPLMEDLNKAAMRTRHWKQLVRVTGGAVNITNQDLVNMTLGQFLELGLQHHADEVMAVVQRAGKDLVIENTLKTYEEIWLSKVFELKKHTRLAGAQGCAAVLEGAGSEYGGESEADGGLLKVVRSRMSVTSFYGKPESRNRKTSFSSSTLTQTVQEGLAQGFSDISLPKNFAPIFEELESHQISLQLMLDRGTASSFTDETIKWQKTLKNVEAVLKVWKKAQEAWIELNDIFLAVETRVALQQESHSFAVASRDFAWLLKYIERSPNILQACAIPDINMKLEKIQLTFEQCKKAISCLVNHKRERYPRLYFLPDRDVLRIACIAYDPRLVNDLIHKVYPGVAELNVSQTTSDEKDCYEISGVKSLVRESLEFNKPVLCDLGVDHWLAGLQSSIKTSLQNSVGQLLEATMENDEMAPPLSAPPNDAILCLLLKLDELLSLALNFKDNTPMQAIALGLQIVFSRKRNEIFSANGNNHMHELRQWLAKLDEGIDVIVPSTKLLCTPPTNTPSLKGVPSVISRDALGQSGSKVKQVTIEVKRAEIRESYIHLLPPQGINTETIFQAQCILNQFVHERELISSCASQIEAGGAGLSDFAQSFSYQSILTYDWQPDALQCSLRSGDVGLDYGFEYLGVDLNLQWMPRRDQSLYYLMRSILTYKCIMEHRIQTTHPTSLVCELAKIIAHPLFQFFHMNGFDRQSLVNVFKGAASTGCWVLIQSLRDRDGPWLTLLSQLHKDLFEALAAKRTSVVLGVEEISLEPNARVFLSVPSSFSGQKGISSLQRVPWSVTTTLFNLQSRSFGSYRTITCPLPDLAFLMKSQLILYGFKHYQSLTVSLTKLAYLLGDILFESNHFLQKEQHDSNSLSPFIRSIIQAGSRLVKKLMDFEKEKLEKMAQSPLMVSFPNETVENEKEFAVAIHSSVEAEPEAGIDTYTIEQQALALALRNTLLSFLCDQEEEILKTHLFKLVFPDAEYDYSFELEETEDSIDESVFESLESQVEDVKEDIEAENESDTSINADHSVPATAEDVITSVLNDEKLIPTNSVISKVLQLRELAALHSLVFVVGSAGSGKSCCINTYLKTQEKIGYVVKRSHLWPGTVTPEELFGFWDKAEGQWQIGLYPAILRKLLQEGIELRERHPTQHQLLCIQVDGEAREHQMDFFCACLSKKDFVTMPDGEVLKISPDLKYIWEIETLGNLSPSLIFGSSLLYLGEDTLQWQTLVDGWLAKQPESKKEYLESLCERYIPSTVNYFLSFMHGEGRSNSKSGNARFIVKRSINSLITCSLSILEASVAHAENMDNGDLENYFNYAILWGFGGCLGKEMADEFGQWWLDTWQDYVRFPRNLQVWEVVVHPEGHEFVHWSTVLPTYTGSYGKGVVPEAFVPTLQNMAILHLAVILSEANMPIMLVGPSGSGKTEIIKERLRSFTSQVTDVLTTAVWGCGSRNGKEIRRRLSASLEWKHSNLHVPRSKKRLMYLVDDLSTQEVGRSLGGTGCETLRQLVTLSGTTDGAHCEWQRIQGVSFFATCTQDESSTATQLPERMTRPWNIFYVPYPSTQEQKCIMGTLVKTHFEGLVNPSSLTLPEEGMLSEAAKNSEDRVELLENLIRLTTDQQETIRSMYLRTSERCYYIFTLETLIKLCRNVCHILPATAAQEDIVAVWISEIHWLYGKILVDKIDYERWKQGFFGITRKFFTARQMEIVTRPLAVVTSLTGDLEPASGSSGSRNYLQLPNERLSKIKETVVHFINENNKDSPYIKLVLFPGILTLLNRLINVIRCPFRNGHSLLIASGSPALPNTVIRAAAYICGFTIAEMHAVDRTEVYEDNPARFNSYLKSVFTNAGTKGDKLLVPVHDNHATPEFLSNVSELILSNSLDNFFDDEEETAIINAIRTDVIQAGLGYSKEVAWKSFLQNVQKNIRFIVVVTEPRGPLQNLSMENPALVSALQILHFHRWEMDELVTNAKYLLKDLKFLGESEKENIAHLQAAMHLKIADLIKEEIGSDFLHLANNDTFQVFVERFVAALQDKQEEIKTKQRVISDTLVILNEVHDSSQKLTEQLDHEKIVLTQKEKGNKSFLQQIGQDRAISEEQLRLLERHQWRTERLKKLLPKYQEAYNRAVLKSMALVKETKHIVQYLPHEALSNLRSLQKPDSEIEDLLAAVIVIVKSPSSDLTWNKGAKRIMANLERFQEDLLSFDEVCIEESHLVIAEGYIAKPHFTPGYLESRTNNTAIGSLVLWVRGVTRYHRMKISRVDPLQAKVEETAHAIEDATQKMRRMQDKVKDLDTRLTSLSVKLEEASVDKSKQRLLTERQGKTLEKAADFEQNLAEVQWMWKGVLESMEQRTAAVVGNVALCTGLLTYLGPFGENFRRRLLLKEWPNCLVERGVAFDPLLFDQDVLTSLDDDESRSIEGGAGYGSDASPRSRSSMDDPGSLKSEDELALAIVNTAISNELFRSWLAMGLVAREIENLAIMRTALHRTLYVMDPYDQMHRYLPLLEPDRGNIMELNAITREPTHDAVLEQAISTGKTLIVYNYHTEVEDSLIPVIEAVNNRCVYDCDQVGEPVLARINGRRIFMPASFRLIIISRCDPQQKPPFSVSGSTIVDLVPDASELSGRLRSLFLSRQNADACRKLQRCRYFYFNVIQAFEILDSRITSGLKSQTKVSLFQETDSLNRLIKEREKLLELNRRLKRILQGLQENEASQWELITCAVMLFQVLVSFTRTSKGYRFCFEQVIQVFCQIVGSSNDSQALPSSTVSLEESAVGLGRNNESASEPLLAEKLYTSFIDSPPTVQNYGGSHSAEEDDKASMDVDATFTQYLNHLLGTELDTFRCDSSQVSQALQNSSLDLVRAFRSNFQGCFHETDEEIFTCLLWFCALSCQHSNATKVLQFVLQEEVSDQQVISQSSKCHWIPDAAWNTLLAAASWFPILNSILESMISSSASWEEWYSSDAPWHLPACATEAIQYPDNTMQEPYACAPHTLHLVALVIIRILRLDAMKSSLLYYAMQSLKELPTEATTSLLDPSNSLDMDKITFIYKWPLDFHSHLQMSSTDVAKRVTELAKSLNKACLVIQVQPDNTKTVDITLNSAVQSDSWILIEDIENGDSSWLTQFTGRLLRLFRQQDVNWRIFLTYQPSSDKLPAFLLSKCHKISLGSFIKESEDVLTTYDFGSYRNFLLCFELTFEVVNPTVWESLQAESLVQRSIAFGVCIYHAILLGIQKFTPRTLSELLCFTPRDLNDALDLFISFLHHEGFDRKRLDSIVEAIYVPKSSTKSDANVLRSLFVSIMDDLTSGTGSFLNIGSWTVPVPPANVSPSDYKAWLMEKLQEGLSQMDWSAFGVVQQLVRCTDKENTLLFLANLRPQFDAITSIVQRDSSALQTEFKQLQQNLNNCIHDLPAPLPGIPQDLSELTLINHCLSQECHLFNIKINRVRISLEEMHSHLIRGIDAFPLHLRSAMIGVAQGRTPSEWLAKQRWPSTVSLETWIKDLTTQRILLSHWISDQNLEMPINLAVLDSPAPFFHACRVQAAIGYGVAVDKIALQCQLVQSARQSVQFNPAGGMDVPFIFGGLNLVGATWDFDDHHLVPMSHSTDGIPNVSVQVSFLVLEEEKQSESSFDCPVCYNLQRRSQLFSLPLPYSGKKSDFHLCNTALVLTDSKCLQPAIAAD